MRSLIDEKGPVPYIVNTMAANGLPTQGTWASADRKLSGIILFQHQTPCVHHCPQIRFGRESDQNLKCTETDTKMRNLFCNNLEYIALFKVIIHVLFSVIYS